MSVAVITPTYQRDPAVLHRAVRCVEWQTYEFINHYICHDGPWTSEAPRGLRVKTSNTPHRTNTYGAGVRQYVMDNHLDNEEFLVFLDDDNVLFPEFVEEHVTCLRANPSAAFSICKIVHNGPLPAHMGEAPKILTGTPPVFRNIDTLQIMVRTEAMRACGWSQYTGTQGYCNDGYTYQRLGEMFPWVELPKLLAIHI